MMLATVQAEGEQENATPEAIAVAGISMKMEFDGLVGYPSAAHALRSETREPAQKRQK